MLIDNGYALVLHTHHRVNKIKEEMKFFELAKDDFDIKKIAEVRHEPMFKEDISKSEEHLKIRTTAHIHVLKHKKEK